MILIDNTISNKPQFNLALEEAILRQKDDMNDYLLIYFNEPSVVIGRHQNVYEEVNLAYCYENNIPVFRRISGGGAVYHDLGNLNFSYINKKSSKLFNNYHPFLEPIVKALNEMGVMVKVNDRNDIILQENKISGSAQFTTKDRMLTHGTLLYNASLINAQNTLNVSISSFYQSKSKKSYRSSIANIVDYFHPFESANHFKNELITLLQKGGVIEKRDVIGDILLQNAQKLIKERYGNWNWNYGRSPACLFERNVDLLHGNVTISCEIQHGIFEKFSIKSDFIASNQLSVIEKLFRGQRNDIITIKGIVSKINKMGVESINWFKLLTEK
jgi:lipoate-protein ligase A